MDDSILKITKEYLLELLETNQNKGTKLNLRTVNAINNADNLMGINNNTELIFNCEVSFDKFFKKTKFSQKDQKEEIRNCICGQGGQLFVNLWGLGRHIEEHGKVVKVGTIMNLSNSQRIKKNLRTTKPP